ncbi:hypothetical protein [Shigella dysenteriae]|nr:hypothetical protein [Shigella dysenteriae]WNT51732.1 hypothetical protein PWP84_05310 [Shigella dysenteriae]
MNVNAGHERTSKARIIHQIQLIRGITGISKKNARLSRKTRSLLQFLTVTPLFVNYFKILCWISLPG